MSNPNPPNAPTKKDGKSAAAETPAARLDRTLAEMETALNKLPEGRSKQVALGSWPTVKKHARDALSPAAAAARPARAQESDPFGPDERSAAAARDSDED